MAHERPTFSIIIPTYQRPAQLAVCLRSLAALDYPRERFEVIVVDDGSTTPLDAVVASVQGSLNVTLTRQDNAGPAAARNTGAARAHGTFLAFTDDDCTPAPDWLHTLGTRFAMTPEHLVGGRTLNALPDNPYSAASQFIMDVVYAYYNADPDQARFFATNNLALPADQFHAVGGFDPALFRAAAEDRDLCDRWLHHGQRMIFAPEAVVYHAHRLTLRTFCRQHFNYGRGAWRFHQMRARRGSGNFRQDLPFHTHLPAELRRVFPQMQRQQAFRLALLLAVWQVANAAGFFWEAVNHLKNKQ